MATKDLRAIVAIARPWVKADCLVCSKPGTTKDPATFTHDYCRVNVNTCVECEGAWSMPYPECTHCKGTGRTGGELCSLCPRGPCVRCAFRSLTDRIKKEREDDRA